MKQVGIVGLDDLAQADRFGVTDRDRQEFAPDTDAQVNVFFQVVIVIDTGRAQAQGDDRQTLERITRKNMGHNQVVSLG